MKIAVCGSMTASKEMVGIENELKQQGHEVILPEFTHDYAQMETFTRMHTESARNKVQYDLIKGYFEKMKSADAVLIANIERKGIMGYIGGNSFLEMGFAFVLDKPIYLLHEIPDLGYRDEIEAMRPIVLQGDLNKIKEPVRV